MTAREEFSGEIASSFFPGEGPGLTSTHYKAVREAVRGNNIFMIVI
jgi:hypothetical protein